MAQVCIKVSKPTLAGNEVSFKVEGKEGNNLFTGSVKMQIEGGSWKVFEDKGILILLSLTESAV